MRNLLCTLSALLLLTSLSYGFGYFDAVTNGTPLPGLTPASAALGTSRAIGIAEPACLFTNPALTANLPLGVQAAASLDSWTERVLQSDVEKTTRTYMTYDNLTGAVVIPAGGFSFNAGYAKVAEFGYEGTHTVYDPSGVSELGVSVLYSSGGQWEAMGGLSKAITGSLSAGFSAGMRMARADYEYFFNSHNISIPDSSSVWSLDETEFAWHGGIALGGDLFKSGVSYSSETDHMQDVVAFGISAFAEHLNDITVGFEGEVNSPFDENHFLGKLSVIMPLRSNLNALTSVSFDDQRVANRAGLGFGLGFDLSLDRMDLTGGVISRFKARKNSAFPDEESDRVDDAVTQFSFGVAYRLGS